LFKVRGETLIRKNQGYWCTIFGCGSWVGIAADQTGECARIKAAAYVLMAVLAVPSAYVTVGNLAVRLLLKAT